MTKQIAIVIDSLAGGGAEKVMLTLAQTMLQGGHNVHLLVLQNFGLYEVPDNLPVHYWKASKNERCDALWGMDKLTQEFLVWVQGIQRQEGKFDLFISNLDKSNLLMSRSQLEPTYFVVHNAVAEELKKERRLGPVKYFKMWRAKKALDGKKLITVSHGIQKEIQTSGFIHPQSVQTIYNPFNVEEIQLQAQAEVKGLPQGDYMVHVGRFAKQKRHDILFQAMREMDNKLPMVLLCNNTSKAKKMAKQYGVEDRIILPGFQANPYPWIKHARLLALSSDCEGLPTVLIESLICDTPVVSTDCPHGPNEIMTGPLAEFLVPCRDPKSLAKAMDRALEVYPDAQTAEILSQVSAENVTQSYLALAD
ncbi:glycosyltransferase [Bowmanella sp. Y26]|uniref:glycosyltransferase n=1 Tax=Bowmanella yangjiangensis TaxID=2811230 RepID=UPI001BDBFE17|nr:glycosyltransferase [Bowmanella yangjiangensis]MBT1065787.1 glycosyltransferase [Bowmanella yangjiangensis]